MRDHLAAVINNVDVRVLTVGLSPSVLKQRAQQKDRPTVFERKTCLHPGAAGMRCLNYDRCLRKSGHDGVALGERPAPRLLTRPELRDDCMLSPETVLKLCIRSREVLTKTRADDRNRACSHSERGRMRSRVDACCKPADNNSSCVSESLRDRAGRSLPLLARSPRTHDGYRALVAGVELTPNEEHRRSVMDHPQVHGIGSVEDGDQLDSLVFPRVDVLLELIERRPPSLHGEELAGGQLFEVFEKPQRASLFLNSPRETVPRQAPPRHECEHRGGLADAHQSPSVEHMFGVYPGTGLDGTPDGSTTSPDTPRTPLHTSLHAPGLSLTPRTAMREEPRHTTLPGRSLILTP